MSGDDEDHADYPSTAELYAIAQWTGPLFDGGLHGWFDMIRESWWCPEWGWKRTFDDYDISTGGWSGNESIIDAMMENTIAWNLTWQQSRRGGHFSFSVPNAGRSRTDPPAATP